MAYPTTIPVRLFKQGEFAVINGKKYVPERTCRNEFDRCFAFECSECGVNVEGGDMLGHNSSEGAFNFCPNCGAKVVGE